MCRPLHRLQTANRLPPLEDRHSRSNRSITPAGELQNVVCESEAVRHLIDGLEMVHGDVVVSVVCPRIVYGLRFGSSPIHQVHHRSVGGSASGSLWS